jgi:hypothetical protein
MAERHALSDAISVGFMHKLRATQTAATLRAFVLAEVTTSSAAAQNFATGGDLEPLGGGFLRFNTFGTSHKLTFFRKERAL